MRYQEFFLIDDAVDDLAKLEAYVLSYQSTNFIEILEDRFFEAFHGLLTTASLIIRYALGREWGTSPRAAHLGYQTAS